MLEHNFPTEIGHYTLHISQHVRTVAHPYRRHVIKVICRATERSCMHARTDSCLCNVMPYENGRLVVMVNQSVLATFWPQQLCYVTCLAVAPRGHIIIVFTFLTVRPLSVHGPHTYIYTRHSSHCSLHVVYTVCFHTSRTRQYTYTGQFSHLDQQLVQLVIQLFGFLVVAFF